MRKFFFGVALAAVLTGSLTSVAYAQTAKPQRKPVPPEMAKECVANFLKYHPSLKFVGPFVYGALTGMFSSLSEGRLVVIAAPTLIGSNKVRMYSACVFRINDGPPRFFKFGAPLMRTERVPGDPR